MALMRCPEGHVFSPRRYGNMCPYCNKVISLANDEMATGYENYNDITPYIGDLEIMNPVTGWLVCIDGPNKGRDYKLIAEKNFIGRADGMDVQILGDNNIAKRNHAIIVYDARNNNFMLLPGESQGLIYLEGQPVYAPTPIASYATIDLGKSKFIFVSFCNKHFEWQDKNDYDDRQKEKELEKSQPEDDAEDQ